MYQNFSILITTYNRKAELRITLNSLSDFIKKGVRVIVCDDGSSDGTSEFLQIKYPEIVLQVNPSNKGLIYSRNLLMEHVHTPYAVILDDDSNFLNSDPFGEIQNYFNKEPKCAVIAFRIYWGLTEPGNLQTSERAEVVKSYVGCGHAWRMKAWKTIPDYPSWYRFYGEENFASLQLFKKDWYVHYFPEILVHHRVDNTARKINADYYRRARKSLRADYFNFVVFYPFSEMIRSFIYSIKMQFIKAVNHRDYSVVNNNILALVEVLFNFRRLLRIRCDLTQHEYKQWKSLPPARIYWKPNSFSNS